MANVGDIVRVALHYTAANASDMMNVLHFKVTGSDMTNTALEAAIKAWIIAVWAPAWDNLGSQDTQLDRFEADIVGTDGLVLETIGGDSINISGGVLSQPLPPGVAAYMMAYTDVPKARGSKYVPGLAESHVDGGVLTGTCLTQLAALLLVYLADADMGGGTALVAGVLSKALGSFLPFTGAGLIDDRPAYQRRRKRDVGA